MPLNVTVRDVQSGAPPWQVALPEPVATIGRNSTCDLVLQDPEKHVSRLHATIELRPEGHVLVVNSKINPIIVDGAVCQPNSIVPLQDGACIGMHPFEVTLRIARAAAAQPAPAQAPVAGDSFGWISNSPAAAASAPDPFGLGLNAQPAPRAPAPQPDPFQRAAAPEPEGLVPGMGGMAAFANLQPPSLDPLAMLGGGARSAPVQSSAVSIDSLLGPGAGTAGGTPLVDLGGYRRESASSALDHVHDINLPFSPPVAPPVTQQAFAPVAPQPVAPQPAPQSTGRTEDSALDWLSEFEQPLTSAPTVAAEPAPQQPVQQQPVQQQPVQLQQPFLQPPPVQPQPIQQQQPIQQPPEVAQALTPPPQPQALAPAMRADATAAVEAFLRGMGDAGFRVSPEQQEEFFEKAGAVVQVTVQGLVTLLLARAEIKKELRAEERTMLASRANNPLKFMGSAQEALRFLFDPAAVNAAAFLAPTAAIEEACSELVAHELGLVAGMRAAVTGVVKSFDPDKLEAKAGKAGVQLPMMRKARLWDLHMEQYAKMRKDMADNIERLFERDFLAAYTEQVRRVNSK